MGSVCDHLAECGTRVEFIVAGYTAKLQALDVGMNRPFKSNISLSRNEFMIAGGRKPTRQVVSNWISESWKMITVSNILNTWNHIGIVSDLLS